MSKRLNIQPVIMSGGAGTRLWPMSRAARPKQFIALASDASLFQETARRVREGDGFLPPLVIAGEKHAELAAAQLGEIGVAGFEIIIEPAARNTAAVAAVAAQWTLTQRPGALALLLPADHRIADEAGFRKAVLAAAPIAASGRIVTFGIKPTEAHSGYGYIERGEAIAGDVWTVAAFREKPDAETAARYFAGGRHFWNAGIFLFDPAVMLDELARHAPAIRKAALAAFESAAGDGSARRLDPVAFKACPADSLDYAIMEKTTRAAIAGPLNIGWSDIGSWSAIESAGEDARILAVDSEGCVIRTDGVFVGAVGVTDLVIVASGGAVLVAHKDRAQDVKKIVEALKAKGRDDLL